MGPFPGRATDVDVVRDLMIHDLDVVQRLVGEEPETVDPDQAPLIVAEIFRILRSLNGDDGVSMLLVEQNARLALELADQAYLLETGRVALSGSSAELMADESVRRTYLGV